MNQKQWVKLPVSLQCHEVGSFFFSFFSLARAGYDQSCSLKFHRFKV